MKTRHLSTKSFRLALALGVCAWISNAHGQAVDLSNRPVADVRIEGLGQVTDQFVRNQIRTLKGDPYDPKIVQEDIVRITHLGRFKAVTVKADPQSDGSVLLTFVVNEPPLIADIQVVGNKGIDDQDLFKAIVLKAGDPIDPFLIERGIQNIKIAYQKEGYFSTDVAIDKPLLDESNLVIYRVREGPRVRIRDIKVEGNIAFTDEQVTSKIRTETYLFIFRKGEFNREQLDADVARIRDFYRDAGYLDAQVGRRVDLSPDQKDGVVVFFVEEGRQYTVDNIRIVGNQIFNIDQIRLAMALKTGDVFSADRLKKTQESLEDLYGKLGMIDVKIQIDREFHEKDAKVDMLIKVTEGIPHTVGLVQVRGNQLTQDKVILRQVRGMQPDRRFDREGIAKTEQRLKESSLFSDAKINILGNPEDETRDVLVEVKEQNTGSLSFGAGISSDAGVIGSIELSQRNFDLFDTPDSLGELFTGKAFRGAGQSFSIALQPGTTTSRYSINFREPYLFDSPIFFDSSLFYYQRAQQVYQEQRIGAGFGLGQRFGDVWSAAIRTRAEEVNITNVDASAPTDVFDVQGNNMLLTVGPVVTRNTTDSRVFPTTGSNWEVGLTRAIPPGDFQYWRVSSDFRKFWTVDEDFFGRRTVFSIRNEVGYIFDADYTSSDPGNPGNRNTAPVFERFYAGGQRTFRGFAYRGAGPRGSRHDLQPVDFKSSQPIGGDFLFLLSAEYNFPIYQDVVRMVFFTDTGTVNPDVSLDNYRVSIGTGIRLKLPFFGQAPFAFDVAVPVIKQPGDQERLFSFDVAIPF